MDMDHTNAMEKEQSKTMPQTTCNPITGGCGHNPFAQDDPENPQNWPKTKKIHASLVATFFVFNLLFGLTSYALAIPGVMKEFKISMTYAIAPFSLYLVGIAFAPLYTPHLSERFGRRPTYFVGAFISALFILGASRAKSIQTLCAVRFLAGLFGGPCAVLIEGTYADIWPAQHILLYYSNLTWASYLGAATGPLVTGFIVTSESWRWTQYVALMVSLAALLFGVGMPETYPREIVRRRARRQNKPHNLPKALSGVTVSEMARLTLIDPVIMFFSEPIVTMFSLQVTLLFGTVFQFFISVPAVLTLVYKFNPHEVALAFLSAIGAIPFAVGTCYAIEAWAFPRAVARSGSKDMVDVEYRLLPAFLGGVFQTAALFWIGFTAAPTFHSYIPIIGTWFFVYGNLLVLIAYISYMFDAYPPAGTLSGLTSGAVLRLLFAAATPLFIIQMILKLGGGKAFSVWGGLHAGWISFTVILYFFGARMRSKSRFAAKNQPMNTQEMNKADDSEGTLREQHEGV